MLVTQTTIVGYTLINGTWGLQLALLIASLYNALVVPTSYIINEINEDDKLNCPQTQDPPCMWDPMMFPIKKDDAMYK